MRKVFCDKGSAYIINDRFCRRYFTGFSLSEGIVVLTETQTVCFTDARYFYGVKKVAEDNGVCLELLSGAESVKNFLVQNGVTTVYLDFDKTTVTEYNLYISQGFTVKDGGKTLRAARAVKTEEEIAKIQKACEIIQQAYYNVLPLIKEGVTEKEIADAIEKECLLLGAESMSFDTIVAFGEGSAVPHHETSDRRLKYKEPILVDTGCMYKGYASDFTRTAFYGEPFEKFVRDYETVKTANELAENTIKAGFSGRQADAVSRDYFKSLDVDGYFTHSLGHGLGLEIHEEPYLSQKSVTELKENSAFTVEPGLYFPNEYGIRIEDTCIIKDGVTKRLFTDDKKLIIIK